MAAVDPMRPTAASPAPLAPAEPPLAVWRICLAGTLGLAVAMGIGRFAFTPMLPLMQREGLLDADGGAWLAAANYVGYLAGALCAVYLTDRPRRLVLASLAAIVAVTAAAGFATALPGYLILRAAAGVLSAWVLVGISSWSLGELARRGRADASGWVFSGVGTGIAAAGAITWAGGAATSAALWWALAVLAAVLAAAVQALWPADPSPVAAPAPAPGADHGAAPSGATKFVACYGAFGFGYILPATFLPAMARSLFDDPRLFGLAWPAFGLAAALSTLVAGRALRRWRLLGVWAACHVVMAIGVALPLLDRSGLAIGASACLVGGTFMVATMTGLRVARALVPQNPAPLVGRMTAAFALGQIAGPLAALALTRAPLGPWSGIDASLALACALLLATALWLHRRSRHLEIDDESGSRFVGRRR